MAAKTSAGLLAYRLQGGELLVFLGHMGGPFWQHKDSGAWSIPKGEYDAESEEPLAVAQREFAEEIGLAAPGGRYLDLGACRQPSGKQIRTYAVPVDGALSFVASNTFALEWPRGSGRTELFPEIDRAEWFSIEEARGKVVGGQISILDALVAALAAD